ncbi:MAG: NUDIX domain-containing protein [Desulfobacterales bacterium]|nr:NUDIX domain-containing protein [Desulfobacterales bacterium]MCP4159974.1 NUDIX domain-containing protein [Deltaproteobacteria bacterium]
MQKKIFCHFCATPLINKYIEGRTRRFCTSCNSPIYENPIPASCLVVINEKDEVLLVKRSVEPQIGMWCLPGGFIELGETPYEAGLRELKEETGLSGKIDTLLGVSTHSNEQYYSVLITGFLIKQFSGSMNAGDDASDVSFFSKNKMPKIAFSTHESFINTYYSIYA